MALTPAQAFERREYARSINSFNERYRLTRPHVTSLDALRNSGRYVDESRLAQRILGIWPPNIGHVPIKVGTQYLYHPSVYLDGPGGAYGRARHKAELLNYRRRQTGVPSFTGIVQFDGQPVVAGFAEVLWVARREGVHFHVVSGYRSIEEQTYLFNHPEGLPVAPPGESHHNGRVFPDGAVDLDEGISALANWCENNPAKSKGIRNAGDVDIVHFSVPGAHHPGEASY